MRIKIREHARRIILSSLLKSDLTISEIKEIGKAFLNESDFSKDLGCLIKDMATSIDSCDRIKRDKPLKFDNEKREEFENMMSLIKRMKIPKREIVTLLKSLRPELKETFLETKTRRTTREMVSFFFIGASAAAIDEFRYLLSQWSSDSDPYLKGIMQRR